MDIKKKNIVLLGAGSASLAAGYILAKNGYNVTIVEQFNYAGGLCRTVSIGDTLFDPGGHRFFTKNASVKKLWFEVLGKENFIKTNRYSRIYYNEKFFNYPVQLGNVISHAGFWTSFKCLTSFLYYRIFPIKPEKSFADWVTNRFGKQLFNMFFDTYTEKVWGSPTSMLSVDWASQRIKGLSLFELVKYGVLNNLKKGQNHVDKFLYPKKGPSMLFDAMVDKIEAMDGKVLYNHTVCEINHSKGVIRAIKCKNSAGKEVTIYADEIISSIPFPTLIGLLDKQNSFFNSVKKKLQFRSCLSVNLIINQKELFPDTWIYIHDSDIKCCRVQNFKNWSHSMSSDDNVTPIGCEYYCYKDDKTWNTSDDKLIDSATNEMVKIGLIEPGSVLGGSVTRMPNAYPIYITKYEESVKKSIDYLKNFKNIQSIGRGGMFRYNNIDHSMLSGMQAAKNLLGENHDIWKINEEGEYLERAIVENEEQEYMVL